MKIAFASLIVGAGLSVFDITASEVLSRVGLTPEKLGELMMRGVEWALPNIMLGSMIIVPMWLVVLMLRPPRG